MERRSKDIIKLFGMVVLGMTLAVSLSKDLNSVGSNGDNFRF